MSLALALALSRSPSPPQGHRFHIGTELMKQTEEEVTLDRGSKFSFRGYEVGGLREEVPTLKHKGFSQQYEAAMFVVPVGSTAHMMRVHDQV